MSTVYRKSFAIFVLCAVLFVIALIVRLPNLNLIPKYTDEGSSEILWALDITLGHHLPLTGSDAYDGPFFAYLIAGLFKIFGLNLLMPRLVVAVFGALTALATLWLGWGMGSARRGFIAASFVATCPALVVIMSHYAFSNSLIPFFFTVAVACIYSGMMKKQNWLIGAGGLLAGIALQTHPTALVGLAGIFFWIVSRQDLRTKSSLPSIFYLVALFVIGYAPMLVNNFRWDSPMLTEASQRTYAFTPTLAPNEYLTRLIQLVKGVLYTIGGGLAPASLAIWVTTAALGFLLVVGLGLSWRRGENMIVFIFASTIIAEPFVIKSGALRYYAFLIPLGYVAIAGAILEIYAWVSKWRPRFASASAQLPQAANWALAIGVIALVAFPIATVAIYYRNMTEQGQTNAEYFRLQKVLREQNACGPRLFVEQIEDWTNPNTLQSALVLGSVNYVITLDACEHIPSPTFAIAQSLTDRSQASWLLIQEQSITAFSNPVGWERIATFLPPEVDEPTALPVVLYHVK